MTARSRKRVALVTNTLLHAYQSELRKSFERAALRGSFDVITVVGRGLGHPNPAERAQNAAYDWLTPEAVDGVVLLSSTLTNYAGRAPLEALIERLGTLPTVSVGTELPRVPSITVDNRAGMRAAIDHLIEVHGCHRVAYAAGPSDNQEARARLEGYRYSLEAHYLPFDPHLVEPCTFSVDGGMTAMQRLLESGRTFDAVVGANDAIAVGAARVLSARGLAVPDNVRLIGFDDSPVAVSALLSSVAQPFNQLGLHALEALSSAMQGRPAHDIAFWPRLALRDSCGCGDAAARGQLPPFRKRQKLSEYLTTHRGDLTECLHEINAACFDWWSTRVDRLLTGLSSAVSGDEAEFLSVLDGLVREAFDDGVPVEQVVHCIMRLQRHFESAGERISLHQLWSRALAQLVATLGQLERRRRMVSMQRLAALRDFDVYLSEVEDEHQLAQRLARDLPGMGVHRAYLGLFDGIDSQELRPCFQMSAPGSVQLGGPAYAAAQLFPEGFPASESPSALLVSAATARARVAGVWACGGDTDLFVFEQLRTRIGDVLERFSSRRGADLEPAREPVSRRGDEPVPPPESAYRPLANAKVSSARSG